MQVRDATASDAAACAAIYAPYVRDSVATFESDPPSIEEMAGRIVAAQRGHSWLVADDDGATVGYAYGVDFTLRPAYRWTCEVSVYLDGRARGRGVGRMLYEALLARLVARGYRTLVARIAVPNAASEALHRSFGFEEAGVLREVGWKHGAWRDVALWQKPVGDPVDPPAEPR